MKIDGFVKSPISALRAISQNFTYAKYAAFFEITQALILNFFQSRLIMTFYDFIIFIVAGKIFSRGNYFNGLRITMLQGGM